MKTVLILVVISAYFISTDGAAIGLIPSQTNEKSGSVNRKRSDDTSLSALEVLVQQQATAIQTLQARLTSLENRQPTSFQPVAFTVQFSHDNSDHGNALGPQGVLKFDNVVTNMGNGYHANTGIFTAPTPGLYVLYLRMMSPNLHGNVELAIDREGQQVLGMVWAQGSSDIDDQGSTMVNLHLSAGEKVWVRQVVGDAIRGGYYTVFSGFLVQAD